MDSRVVLIPIIQNKRHSDEREDALLIVSLDSPHLNFLNTELCKNTERKLTVRKDSKLVSSVPGVFQVRHELRWAAPVFS